MTKLVFLDTETTSLRPDRRAWDVALIVREPDGKEAGYRWLVLPEDLDLGNADPKSLQIGGFYDRHPAGKHPFGLFGAPPTPLVFSERRMLTEVERVTRGATIVGAVPNFDTEVLAARMRAHGIAPSWNYHLVDVEALAAGALGMPPPWDFNKLLDAFGLAYDEQDRHTAPGDARMVQRLYDAVMSQDRESEGDEPEPDGGRG